MAQSPAQKAAFEKMLAARKAKSGNTETQATTPAKPKVGNKTRSALKSAKSGRMSGAQATKTAARIKQRLSTKKKNRTQVGFD